jgi:hypothetical protein
MSNWVYDGTTNSGSLNMPKTDGAVIPVGGDPTKFVAGVEYNVVGQALTDVRFAIISGSFFGFGSRLPSGSLPAGAKVTDDFLFLRQDGALIQHKGTFGGATAGDFVIAAAAANVLYQQYSEIVLPTGSNPSTVPGFGFGSPGGAIVYLKNNGQATGQNPAVNRSQLVIRWSIDGSETILAESPAI